MQNTNLKYQTLILLLLSLCSVSSFAGVIASNTWIRQVPPVAENTAAYFTLKNKTEKDIRIIGMTTDIAKSATMHDMVIKDEMTSMVAIKSLLIPVGETIEFIPGAKHLMLINLTSKLIENQSIDITFEFEDGTKQIIPMIVRKLAPKLNSDAHHHH